MRASHREGSLGRVRGFGHCLVFLIKLFVDSLNIDLIAGTGLKASPVSSVPCMLDLGFSLALNGFAVVFDLFLVTLRLLVLHGSFGLRRLLRVPVSVLFKCFVS